MSFQDIDNITQACASTFAFSDSDSDNILFPEEATQQLFDSKESVTKRLENLKKKEIRYNLHGSTLSHYWRSKRIPRGLRIDKEPTLGRNNKDFCKKWCEVLNKCSLDLMLLIIEHVNGELTTTREEVSQLEKDFKTKFGAQQFKDMDKQCDAILKSYQTELQEMKLHKYRQVALDYKDDRVYKWMSRGEAVRRPYRTRQWGADAPRPSQTSSEESGAENTATRQRFLAPRYTATRSRKKDPQDVEVRDTGGSKRPV